MALTARAEHTPTATGPAAPPHHGRTGTAPILRALSATDPARPELEQFIAATYRNTHDARISSFMPTLLALQSTGGVRAVAGVRPADTAPLFLEQYLDDPIETALGAAIGRPVHRRQIAEIGNLAARECRSACRLALLLPAWLGARGHDWVVFTATDVVRGILAGLGAPLVELAKAQPARLREPRDDWGRYYATDPRVVAAWLPAGGALTRHGFRQRRVGSD